MFNITYTISSYSIVVYYTSSYTYRYNSTGTLTSGGSDDRG